jgi:hypothetical protein
LNTLTFKEISKHKTNSTRKIRKPCKQNTNLGGLTLGAQWIYDSYHAYQGELTLGGYMILPHAFLGELTLGGYMTLTMLT